MRGLAAIFVAAVLAGGCGSNATGVRLTVSFDAAAGITQLQIDLSSPAIAVVDRVPAAAAGALPSGTTVLVLLPDSAAGVEAEFLVQGLAGGAPVAARLVRVTPEAGAILEVAVMLDWDQPGSDSGPMTDASLNCGDGVCDPAMGETDESCGADCGCAVPFMALPDSCGQSMVPQGCTAPGCCSCGVACSSVGNCCADAAAVCEIDCGDTAIGTGESCDESATPPVRPGTTCASVTGDPGASGTVECLNCLFDPANCLYCGDGIINNAEECDGSLLGGQTCATQGFAGGTLGCDAACELDTSGCV